MFLAEFHRLRRLSAEGINLGLLRRGEADSAHLSFLQGGVSSGHDNYLL